MVRRGGRAGILFPETLLGAAATLARGTLPLGHSAWSWPAAIWRAAAAVGVDPTVVLRAAV